MEFFHPSYIFFSFDISLEYKSVHKTSLDNLLIELHISKDFAVVSSDSLRHRTDTHFDRFEDFLNLVWNLLVFLIKVNKVWVLKIAHFDKFKDFLKFHLNLMSIFS